MARILFLTNTPTPYQLDFFDELARHHDVRVLHQGHAFPNHAWQLGARPWLAALPPGTLRKTLALRHEMRTHRPDAVLIGGYTLPLSERCKWLARSAGARVAYWLEKPHPARGARRIARTWLVASRLGAVDRVFCIGSQAVAAYAPYAKATTLLPYAIAPDRYRRRPPRRTGPVRFVFAGQLIERKGVRELLEAFARLAPGSATLTIAGTGPLAAVVTDAAARDASILALGFVEPNALPALLAAHDVFVLPSRFDGWAVVVAEAMASGLPVIGTRDTGAANDLIVPGHNGELCEVSGASIAAAMRRYADHPEVVDTQGAAALAAFLGSRAATPNARAALEAALEEGTRDA